MQIPLQLQTVQIEEHTVQLYVPEPNAIKDRFADGSLQDPYWSQVWPASRALAEFLLTHPQLVKEKTVLELGAGLGLPSLTIAPLVHTVTCTDKMPEAVAVSAHSALLNGFSNFFTAVLDWSELPPDLNTDVVLLSDVNYEQQSFTTLLSVLNRFLLEGKQVILATPQRLMAKDFIGSLLPFVRQQHQYQINEGSSSTWITVLFLQNL